MPITFDELFVDRASPYWVVTVKGHGTPEKVIEATEKLIQRSGPKKARDLLGQHSSPGEREWWLYLFPAGDIPFTPHEFVGGLWQPLRTQTATL